MLDWILSQHESSIMIIFFYHENTFNPFFFSNLLKLKLLFSCAFCKKCYCSYVLVYKCGSHYLMDLSRLQSHSSHHLIHHLTYTLYLLYCWFDKIPPDLLQDHRPHYHHHHNHKLVLNIVNFLIG